MRMIKPRKAGIAEYKGELSGKLETEVGNIQVTVWQDLQSYNCPHCKALLNPKTMEIIEQSCSRHRAGEVKVQGDG